jgi:plastocyanin
MEPRIMTPGRLTLGRGFVLAGLAAAIIACNKSPSVPSPGSTPSVATNTVTITSNGANPRNIQIALGTRVLFVNNDTRSHNMTSDPHPDHSDCPDIDQVGFLAPGQSRETGNLVVARTCGFHDHDNPSQQNLQGQIVIR